jgi:hypothetical protein
MPWLKKLARTVGKAAVKGAKKQVKKGAKRTYAALTGPGMTKGERDTLSREFRTMGSLFSNMGRKLGLKARKLGVPDRKHKQTNKRLDERLNRTEKVYQERKFKRDNDYLFDVSLPARPTAPKKSLLLSRAEIERKFSKVGKSLPRYR